MRKVIVFMMTTLDGYVAGSNGEIDWHGVDEEFNEFAIQQLDSVGVLMFGRVTYEGMASYWPTSAAIADDPQVAERMNTLPKIVFSRTLKSADWHNTRLISENIAAEIQALKQQPGDDLMIFGSSNLCASLFNLDLLDEARIMVNPVVLGGGQRLFEGVDHQAKLKLVDSRIFRSGNALLYYQPDKSAS